jgi:hypothetical protein
MAFKQMSEQDQKVIGECLRAAPIFLEEDLETVTGVGEVRFQNIADLYPDVDGNEEDVYLAIHGALLNLLGYPHGMFREWAEFISVPPEELALVFERWQALKIAKN